MPAYRVTVARLAVTSADLYWICWAWNLAASAAGWPDCLPPIQEGRFREVKTGVLLLPTERVEPSPGRRSAVRRFLTCWGDADAIFALLYAQLRESGWVGADTVVVIVGDGAEWIWNRATMFVRRGEILDFWHAPEHAWEFAPLRYGEGSAQADRGVHEIAEHLRAGKVQDVSARLKRVRPKTAELRQSLQSLVRAYSENARRMRYDEYLRLGYGIGSGAVESAHKQVVHARFRPAGMRWSEAGARRLLALPLLLWNDNWALVGPTAHGLARLMWLPFGDHPLTSVLRCAMLRPWPVTPRKFLPISAPVWKWPGSTCWRCSALWTE